MPPIPKKIRIKETGRVYLSAQAVAQAINGDKSTIHACLRGMRGSHKGYTFEYVEEQDA